MRAERSARVFRHRNKPRYTQIAIIRRFCRKLSDISLPFRDITTFKRSFHCIILAEREACTTFCTHSSVKGAFKRRNISNAREISLNFLQYRRIIAVCVYLGLFRRRKKPALRSARITQCKERLNVEVPQTGEKYRLISFKIDELLQFACI